MMGWDGVGEGMGGRPLCRFKRDLSGDFVISLLLADRISRWVLRAQRGAVRLKSMCGRIDC